MNRRKFYVCEGLLRVIGALFAVDLLLLAAGVHLCLKSGGWVVFALSVAAWVAIGIYFVRVCLKRLRETEKMMELYASGYTIEDICRTDSAFSRGTEKAMEKTLELLDTAKLLSVSKRQAQYLALQNQINPHFLYNTLEGVRSEALMAGLDLVADMTEALAKFFRYTISRVENLVPVADEVDNIQTYFSIQQFRFGDRLRMEVDCAEDREEIYACLVPKLTLQPIVENAIIHGIEGRTEDGVVRITMTLTRQRLLIQVSDNGIGMEAGTLHHLQEQLSKTTYEYIGKGREDSGGIALLNVNNRIRLLFGEEYGITICSTPGVGTDVTVALPADAARVESARRRWRT